MTVVQSRTLRIVHVILGIFSVGIAFVGIVLPIIPTVGPVLLAGFFFSRSSERFDRWLVDNRLFGGIVTDWRAGLGFTPRSKAIAIGAIAATFTVSIVFVIEPLIARVGFVALAVALVVYIAQLPTKRTAPTAT